jgi:catechol 2,3-dioxygenase-like lactoylglutathione lyase family enzyme
MSTHPLKETVMRVQLALNVKNLEQAVEFYSKAFGAQPNKRKPGYANFALDHPPLKLVLLENPGASERLNHLGVEVFQNEDVEAQIERLGAQGLPRQVEQDTTCCYAKQNKVWSADPDGARWEWYRVLENSDTFGKPPTPAAAPSVEAPAAASACGSADRVSCCGPVASANP